MGEDLLQVQFKLSISGKLFTFYRGCSSGGAQGVAVVRNFKVYTRLCSTSLCNDWDGIAEDSTVDHSGSGDQD